MSAFFLDQARRLLATRDLPGALEACRRAVEGAATDAEAWFIKATVELALGRAREALESARRTVAITPRDARYWTLVGNAEQDAGDNSAARDAYAHAAELAPGWALAWNRLGTVCFEMGDTREAAQAFERAVERDPSHVRAWNNLAHSLLEQGRLDDAERSLMRALALQPDYAIAFYNLARVARLRGDADRALEYATLAERLDPALADAALLAAELLRRRGDMAGAKAKLERLLNANPDSIPARNQLGELMWEAGFPREGREQYRLALGARPRSLRAALGANLLVPPVYASSEDLNRWREDYSAGLASLEESAARFQGNAPEALARDAQWSNFYLAYQGGEDVELQRRYGRFIAAVLAKAFPRHYAEIPRRPRRSRPRVGFFSHFFFNCTAGRYFKSWITDLDRGRFESYVYYTNDWIGDDTREISAACDHFRHAAGMPLAELARLVSADELDILVFPELGMHAASFALASMRLAPVQASAWGHPVTTGHPNIDHYLSVAGMEPEDAQASYTETLHLLPGLGTRYSAPAARGDVPRAALGLPEDRHLFLVPQSLFKIHPENDALLARVLDADPRAHLVLFEARQPQVTQSFMERLSRAIGGTRESAAARMTLLPYMPHEKYLEVNAACDVMLDTLHWSGGNTSLDALAAGLPVVTRPGRFMRGRQSAAMLELLGLDELVARDDEDYVARAVALGGDPAERARLKGELAARRDALFDRGDAIGELHRFLDAMTA